MLRHTEECRTRGIPFAADPSQQLACRRRSADPPPRRRRRLPVQQRVRGGAHRAARPAGATTTSSPGSASGSPRTARTAIVVEPRAPSRVQVPVVPASARRRPHRRRRRLPGRLPRRPGLGSGPRSGAPRWARCSPPTCSRRWARRSTGSSAAPPASGSADAYGDAAAADLGHTPRGGRAGVNAGAGRGSRSSRRPVAWQFDLHAAEPGEDLVAVGADLRPGTLLAAYRARAVPDGRRPPRRGPVGWWSPDPARRAAARRAARHAGRCARRRAGSRSASTPPSTRWSTACADPSRRGALDHPRGRAPPTAGCTGWAGRTRSSAGARASSPAGCTGSRSAACSPASRCSTASATPPRSPSSASSTLLRADGDPRRLLDVQWRTDAPGLPGGDRGAAGGVPDPAAVRAWRVQPPAPAPGAGAPGLRVRRAFARHWPEVAGRARDGVPARGAAHRHPVVFCRSEDVSVRVLWRRAGALVGRPPLRSHEGRPRGARHQPPDRRPPPLGGPGALVAAALLSGCGDHLETGWLPSTSTTTNQTGRIISLWNGSWIAALAGRRPGVGPDPLVRRGLPAAAQRRRASRADPLQPAARDPLHRRAAHDDRRCSSSSPRATRRPSPTSRPSPT